MCLQSLIEYIPELFADGDLSNIGPYIFVLTRFLSDVSLCSTQVAVSLTPTPSAHEDSVLHTHSLLQQALCNLLPYVLAKNLQLFRAVMSDYALALKGSSISTSNF